MASESPSNALIKAAKCPPLPLPPPSLAARWLLSPLAIVSYILSLPVLAFAIWLVTTSGYSCEGLLQTPKLRVAIAVGLFLVFVVSNFVSHYGSKLLIPGNLVLSIMLVLMLTVGLCLVGTYKMETRSLPGTPMWLKHKVENGETWEQVKNCLRDIKTCEDLAYRTILLTAPSDFSSLKLSAVESGCCKPPDHCGMKYVNATYWKPGGRRKARIDGVGVTSAASSSSSTSMSYYGSDDCPAWVNDPGSLCYNCRSCKNGFMRAIASRWRKNGVFLIVMSVLLVAVHMARFVLLMTEKNTAA